ncbi:gamma-glutamylcyclotransferase family protein [Longimicrobium sp.]|uniref:gamma-glutamylcyclotransferase family protein n=1 Tax=Longimicrobium sp. TaxID=2029185 RepID=UPI003B3B1D07
MTHPSLDEVNRLVAAANAARWRDEGADRGDDTDADDAERRLEDLFQTGQTLAVYGTLAPGEPNHHVVAPLGGEWTDGVVEGDLFPVGWGATLGYPAFRPVTGGAAVAAKVLTSAALPAAWPELDRFEGAEYRRILVPVFAAGPADERRLHTVANLYAAADAGPGAANPPS